MCYLSCTEFDNFYHIARTLIDVLRETKEVQNWSELSLLIGISEATYGQIVKQCSTVQEQQRAIITSWLSTGKASWAVLVSGLRDELVGKAAVGDRIAQKYPAKKGNKNTIFCIIVYNFIVFYCSKFIDITCGCGRGL